MDKDDISCWFVCDDKDLYRKVKPLLGQVLRAAWSDVRDRIDDVEFIVVTKCFYSEAPNCLIILDGQKMRDYDKHNTRYVIAHELGHFMASGEGEQAADEYVKKWGFERDMLIFQGHTHLEY